MSNALLFVHVGPDRALSELRALYDRIAQLARDGARVTLFLAEDGVLQARRGQHPPALEEAARAGVEILVDRDSLQARGIRASRLVSGAHPASLDILANRVASGERATWI